VSGDWRDLARCAGSGMTTLWPFFGPEGERQPERDKREKVAKKVCVGCQVRAECLNFAIGNYGVPGERVGVWGGLGEDERDAENKRRLRAAAKEAAA
jgi:WhiB family transcriptional regulator, redox-sensing transcriptional regulator